MTKAAASPTPAHLFLAYWQTAAALKPNQRSAAVRMPAAFLRAAREIAGQEDPQRAVEGLEALTAARTETERRGRMLAVMDAIDMLFAMLHPRTPRAATRRAARPPAWLVALQDERMTKGAFLVADGHALIPRGPLLRTARDPDASSADTLADRFAYLTAIPLTLDDKGSMIDVCLKCVGMDLLTGVEPIADRGNERIAFIPVAETADDLEIRRVDRGGNPHAYYGPAAGHQGGERLLSALGALEAQDLAVAPELVMSVEQTRQVQAGLPRAPGAPRLILLGTRHSEELEEDQAFNEAVLVNSVGSELWRQCKLWPAKLDPEHACQLGLCDEGNGAHIPEDNVSSREIKLVDIDGFGRVLVLICQDLKLAAIEPLIEASQPDWILVPVLADNLALGRWAHRRALAISENTQSRFVGVTSCSLAFRYETEPGPIGFALGPAQPADENEPPANQRAVMFVPADPQGSPVAGTTRWHGSGWGQSRVGSFAAVPETDP